MLYGAPIWADALCSNPSYGAACQRACRTIALRVACAYRTVSDIALSVVAGLPPVHLLAAERTESYRECMAREEDDFYQGQRRNLWSRKTAEEWQRRWDIVDKGLRTHRVIPCVGEWTERRHGLITFHLTHTEKNLARQPYLSVRQIRETTGKCYTTMRYRSCPV